MAIALSPGGSTIQASATPSAEMFVATAEGLVILERVTPGSDWRVAHRALTDQHLHAVEFEPRSGMVFAGAYQNGVFASADGGRTWEPRNEGLAERNVYSLLAVPLADGVRLYAGTEPAHLFCSDDLGRSWREQPALRSVPSVPHWMFPAPPNIGHLKHLTHDPHTPTTLYASIEVGALLRSTDAGETWHELPGVYEDVHRVVVRPDNPRRVYTMTGTGLYVTEDGGASWEKILDQTEEIGGYPEGLVLSPSNPDLLFLGAAQRGPGSWRESHYAGARVARSRDGGRTWEVLQGGLPERLQGNIEALSLEESGGRVAVYAGTTAGEIYASEDGGDHWSLIGERVGPVSKGDHYRPLLAAV